MLRCQRRPLCYQHASQRAAAESRGRHKSRTCCCAAPRPPSTLLQTQWGRAAAWRAYYLQRGLTPSRASRLLPDDLVHYFVAGGWYFVGGGWVGLGWVATDSGAEPTAWCSALWRVGGQQPGAARSQHAGQTAAACLRRPAAFQSPARWQSRSAALCAGCLRAQPGMCWGGADGQQSTLTQPPVHGTDAEARPSPVKAERLGGPAAVAGGTRGRLRRLLGFCTGRHSSATE